MQEELTELKEEINALPIDERILLLIMAELEKAEEKHPIWPKDMIHAAAIVGEESGELIRAALQFKYENGEAKEAFTEAIQTAVTSIRFLKNYHTYIQPPC